MNQWAHNHYVVGVQVLFKYICSASIASILNWFLAKFSIYPNGYATCLEPSHMEFLHSAIALPQTAMSTPTAGLFPEFELIEMFASKLPGVGNVCMLLEKLVEEAKLDGMYFFCKQESLMTVSRMLQKVPFQLHDGLSINYY